MKENNKEKQKVKKEENMTKFVENKISFIICTYSTEFFSDTLECISSLTNQDYDNKEIIIVMDKNDELYDMLIRSVPESVNIIINDIPGLSEARNLGIKSANGDIVVFIDDDAIADKNYISNLIKNYDDEKVVGVTGKIFPKGIPNYPEELYWIGGFTNKGFPEERCEVRNGYGCNMSFKRDIFDKVGSFNPNFGRTGKKLVTCEETEFSIRLLNSIPGSKIVYDPSIIVYHKVHEYRQSFRYMIKRAYHEGISKAHIDKLYKNNNGNKALSTENNYLKYLFTEAIPGRIKNIIIGKDVIHNIKDIMMLLTVVTSVGFGYMTENMKRQDKK